MKKFLNALALVLLFAGQAFAAAVIPSDPGATGSDIRIWGKSVSDYLQLTTVGVVTLTQPATAATITIIDNKTFTVNKTLTLDGTDGTTMTFPSTSATIARTDAANTFTGIQTMTSPALTTPVLGVAAATSINKVALTAPATSATLTILDGKTLTINKSITLEGTDSTVMTFPTTSATIARTDAANTFTGVQTMTSPVLVTPSLGVASATSLAIPNTAATGITLVSAGSANNKLLIKNGDSHVISVESNGLGTHYLLTGDSTGSGGPTTFKFGSGASVEWNSATGLQSGSIDSMMFRKGANIIGVGTTVVGTTDGFWQGKYKSSDGTSGATTTCTIVGLTSITVKDGLITGCS